MGNLIQMFLPKQADIDKILNVILRKILKGTHLQVVRKKNQARYLASSQKQQFQKLPLIKS